MNDFFDCLVERLPTYVLLFPQSSDHISKDSKIGIDQKSILILNKRRSLIVASGMWLELERRNLQGREPI